jgi:hypothetical protein
VTEHFDSGAMEHLRQIGDRYSVAIARAQASGVAAQPEAQLTVPIHALFIDVAAAIGLPEAFELLREAQVGGVIPDFAALYGGRPCGWVELKAPGHSLDGERWRGREKAQWELLAQLDALVVTDGRAAVLYSVGTPVAQADLPGAGEGNWDPAPLADMLRLFTGMRPATITRVSQLADRLAPLARMLRERIYAGLQPASVREPIRRAKAAWLAHVHEGADDRTFASDLAQVISYSLAIAALRGGADVNRDHYITLGEARDALRGPNDMLAAALGPALEVPGLQDELRPEIGAIERLASAVDPARVAASRDSRGEPWLWFYEDFLARYDPAARREAGVYYTPTEIVGAQVRLVDQILTSVFSKPLSFGDPNVVTLDPATGSGTYPLTVLDRAAEVATSERGIAGPRQVARSLARNLIAFELMPGPYAVAHLRIGQRLAELAETLTPPEHVRVYLTDTLEDPHGEIPTLGLWGDVAVLAEERERAARVKSEQPVTVVMGNPPYARRAANSGGGWVVHPGAGRPLFADVIEPAQQAGVIFSAQRSLYDDYVYFWRWSLWKAFEQNPDGPAVVSLITSSNWLRGPAFVGLRRLARELADEMWIVDLGGGNRGAVKDENVFAIQTAVAIVTLYRAGRKRDLPATARYRRIEGRAAEKLSQLKEVPAPLALDADSWTELDVGVDEPLVPPSGDGAWESMPALTDLFPWQQPGVNFGRSWATSPSRAVLEARWRELMRRTDAQSRAEAFVTAKSGRNIHTQVRGLPRLSELPADAPHRGLVRLAFRSFDRQWTFDDPRVALLERPSLWNSLSTSQIFMATMPTNPLGEGQALVVTAQVPDFHFFANRGGKDVIPLYRDRDARPNLASGLLAKLSGNLGIEVSPEDVAAYVFALLAHPGYQRTFASALENPGPRVPMTADREIFERAAALGKYLLWLQTYAERMRDSTAGRGDRVPSVAGLGWSTPVDSIPVDMSEIDYDEASRELRVGSGVVSGVAPEVWEYKVSGFPAVPRWLGSRTAKGVGRASSPKLATPLDRIRPTSWEDSWNDELLDLLRVLTISVDLRPEQQRLLEEVLAHELIDAQDLPAPTSAERVAPRA